jgi:glutamyl-tRNA synthetase
MAARLVAAGHAYYCYCPPDELKAKREAAEAAGGAWKYDRTCRRLSAETIAERERNHVPRAVRVLVPDGPLRFDDLVHGPIEIDGSTIEDFVVLRSDGQPTYHLSVVSDDVEMRITHVVRGDDHISNTPKQLLLYKAVEAPIPSFAHVPLILGPDKKRLSKRHGAISVMEYARRGYLPEAMTNFLALLGWSPGGDQEIFTRDDIVAAFDLGGISGGNAVFNLDKLDWFNQQHLFRMAPDELAARVKPWLEAAGLWNPEFATARRAWFSAVLELLRPRAKRLDEFAALGRFFFTDTLEYDDAAVAKHLAPEGMEAHLGAVDATLDALATFDHVSIEGAIREVAESRDVKAATLIHGVRVALTGKSSSPGLFEVASLLGRERVRARLRTALRRTSSLPRPSGAAGSHPTSH